MKCISIWQPWASLLFAPATCRKQYETRPNRLGLQPGERLLIHASLPIKGLQLLDRMASVDRQHFVDAFDEMALPPWAKDLIPLLPRGAIIGRVTVGTSLPTEALNPSDRERAFGDWQPGRVAILTTAPVLFAEPIPYRGQQGVFYVPDSVVSEVV